MSNTTNKELSMLPPDLHMNFSKWFYSDIEAIKPRRDCVERCEKRPDKEVVPTRIVPDNSLFRDKLKFLTDDLDQDELAPIKQLTNYKLSLVELDPEPDTSETGPQRKKRRATKRLQIILQSNFTIIDRRPMLKKRRTDAPVDVDLRGSGSPPSSSTTLISPDEDCDDSFDDDIPEIDCDAE